MRILIQYNLNCISYTKLNTWEMNGPQTFMNEEQMRFDSTNNSTSP